MRRGTCTFCELTFFVEPLRATKKKVECPHCGCSKVLIGSKDFNYDDAGKILTKRGPELTDEQKYLEAVEKQRSNKEGRRTK